MNYYSRKGTLFLFFLLFLTLAGCAQKSGIEEAKRFAAQADIYYKQAVDKYLALIAEGKDLERLYFELGGLYFAHSDFKSASGAFKKTSLPQAKKLLGITYYRLGNFTDAYEVFSRAEPSDDEYLYYFGLTCEKLNLFDQALAAYKKIKTGAFAGLSLERMNTIEKAVTPAHIKDTDAAVNDILQNAPSQEEYPQAGALILYCDEKIEVSPENTQTTYLHYLVKILNERGKENFSETNIDYDSTFEKVELEMARTIRPDGSVAEVGSRHIRDVSRYMNFPLYSNARVFIISFPEIAEGAVIEYKVRIRRNQLVNKKDFVLIYPLQASEPIIAANLTIDLPKDKALQIKKQNEEFNNFGAGLSPKAEESDGRVIYRWGFKNIPQIIPETNMPEIVEVNPAMLMSTFSSWQEVYSWWQALSRDKIIADAAIKEKVRELTSGKETDEAKAAAIYNFCAQDIRYVAVEYGQAGYEPHPAGDIFRNKYGDCKDQAILLVTMLKEAGFSAWPVLISTRDYYNLNNDLPAMVFNHCIAAMQVPGKTIFMDPTAETCAFGSLPVADQNRRVLIFKEDNFSIEETPLYPAGHNFIKQELKITINSDESISAEKSIFSSGIYEQVQRYWLLYTPPELIEQALKERIQDISIGATLDKYNIANADDLTKALAFSYVFHGSEYFTSAGRLRLLPQLAQLDASLVAHERRKYALDFATLDTKEAVFEITVPQGFAVKYLPEDVKEESPWLSFSAAYERKENRIIFRQVNVLKKNVIPAGEYADFKVFFEGLARRIKQRIILEKIK